MIGNYYEKLAYRIKLKHIFLKNNNTNSILRFSFNCFLRNDEESAMNYYFKTKKLILYQ